MPSITKVLDKLTGCINNLEGEDAKWKLDKIIQFYTKRAFDPVRLIKDLDGIYLAPTIKALDPWFHKTVSNVMKDGEELLENIANGNMSYDLKWANGVVKKGWDAIASEEIGLVSVKGMGVLKCLARAFGAPIYKVSRPHLANIILEIVKPAVKFLAESLKALENWFQKKVEEAMSGDDWFAQLTKMIRAAILKTCMDKFRALDWRNRVKSNSKLELSKVGKNLVPMFFEKVKVWAIYHVVDPLAKLLMKASREVSNMIMHGVDALSGLIPFWGGLVGMLASSAGAVGKQLESTFSYKSIVSGFEKVFSWIEKEVVKLVVNGLDKLQEELSENPIGKIILKILNKVVRIVGGPLVKQCTSSIDRLANLRNITKKEFEQMKKKFKLKKPRPPPKKCKKFTAKSFKGRKFSVTQKSKLHKGQVYTYDITIGKEVIQRSKNNGQRYKIGKHQAYAGMKEFFTKGDGPCPGGVYRSAIVTFQYGKGLKLIQAKEIRTCKYRYLVQLPRKLCKPTPKPTPKPTRKPTPRPTPHPDFWSHCYLDQKCRRALGRWNRVYSAGRWGRNAFRRRDADGTGRDDCIQLQCRIKGLIWDQSKWKDCGHWTFAGKCTQGR